MPTINVDENDLVIVVKNAAPPLLAKNIKIFAGGRQIGLVESFDLHVTKDTLLPEIRLQMAELTDEDSRQNPDLAMRMEQNVDLLRRAVPIAEIRTASRVLQVGIFAAPEAPPSVSRFDREIDADEVTEPGVPALYGNGRERRSRHLLAGASSRGTTNPR